MSSSGQCPLFSGSLAPTGQAPVFQRSVNNVAPRSTDFGAKMRLEDVDEVNDDIGQLAGKHGSCSLSESGAECRYHIRQAEENSSRHGPSSRPSPQMAAWLFGGDI